MQRPGSLNAATARRACTHSSTRLKLGALISAARSTTARADAGGALLAGPAADRLGRRGALRWNCLTLILAAVGCSTATSLQHLIYARTLAGVVRFSCRRARRRAA